jgi:hypothetical protein
MVTLERIIVLTCVRIKYHTSASRSDSINSLFSEILTVILAICLDGERGRNPAPLRQAVTSRCDKLKGYEALLVVTVNFERAQRFEMRHILFGNLHFSTQKMRNLAFVRKTRKTL